MPETNITTILTELKKHQLPLWHEFPDFNLYMDQLVSLSNRYIEPLTGNKITPSMVNSYVKKKIMSKPLKKKYRAEHMAELLVISLLKTVYALDTVRTGLQFTKAKYGSAIAYDHFANYFNELLSTITIVDGDISNIPPKDSIPVVEQFAIQAVLYKKIGEKLISDLPQE